ncbi:MAG: leucine--tRNA ligase [Planctomycetes bacterium]|nr:leucine--tRNA ligase [Planctomycetota bacterium]
MLACSFPARTLRGSIGLRLEPRPPLKNTYEPSEIEPRWQRHWEERGLFRAMNPGEEGFDPRQPKFYVLDMFPYPSGAGLHVGHPIGYIGSDIVARRKRMEGCNVLHPMGYDAFGLPAEQYAIQTGQHPAETTRKNIATYRRQFKALGLSFDWSRELATSEPEYYRWTQWIFARLFDLGLAYQSEVPVWWCEELKTVLANEEVINGRSERGGHPCVKRPLKQWMLKITAYAERLLADLDGLDWPEHVKTMQREWIGRSEGAEVEFAVEGAKEKLAVFTTRPDTLYGATFLVLAPEHPLVAKLTSAAKRAEVEAYVRAAGAKSDLERTDLAKEKSGVFLGAWARNPAREAGESGARIPIWIADYVLAQYGTGAIMAVPGQDERDWEFAERFELPIVRTVQPPEGFDGKAYVGDGPAIASPRWDGKRIDEAKRAALAWLESSGQGRAKVTYKLRDWLFSRQRYWGEPFPVLHHADGKTTRVPDELLPVELPAMKDFTPSANGSPPLARAKEWLETRDPVSGKPVRRDTDTMPGWAGSCWYYLRFMDPKNDQAPFAAEAQRYWGSVDLYVGGVEHAVLHLLYARFWHKVLYDLKLVSTKEPFQRLFNQGLLTAFAYKDSTGRLLPEDEVIVLSDVEKDEQGDLKKTPTNFIDKHGKPVERVIAKMSKSLKNVVNPDDVVKEYGVDTFRVYEMFMGPLGESKPWNPRDVAGSRRFLDRLWRLLVDEESESPLRADLLRESATVPAGDTLALERALNKTLARIEDSFQQFNFNTAIAAMMEFVNEGTKRRAALTRSQAERFLCALAPFAPHLAEELWARLGHAESITRAAWPKADPAYLVEDEVELAVQVNGKLRARIRAPKDAQRERLEELGRAAVSEHLSGKTVKKVVVVPGRLVNFVGD